MFPTSRNIRTISKVKCQSDMTLVDFLARTRYNVMSSPPNLSYKCQPYITSFVLPGSTLHYIVSDSPKSCINTRLHTTWRRARDWIAWTHLPQTICTTSKPRKWKSPKKPLLAHYIFPKSRKDLLYPENHSKMKCNPKMKGNQDATIFLFKPINQ